MSSAWIEDHFVPYTQTPESNSPVSVKRESPYETVLPIQPEAKVLPSKSRKFICQFVHKFRI